MKRALKRGLAGSDRDSYFKSKTGHHISVQDTHV